MNKNFNDFNGSNDENVTPNHSIDEMNNISSYENDNNFNKKQEPTNLNQNHENNFNQNKPFNNHDNNSFSSNDDNNQNDDSSSNHLSNINNNNIKENIDNNSMNNPYEYSSTNKPSYSSIDNTVHSDNIVKYGQDIKSNYINTTPRNNENNTPITKKTLSIALSICMVVSLLLGALGGTIAYHLKSNSSSPLSLNSNTGSSGLTQTTAELVSVADVAAAVENTVVEITTEVVTTGSFLQQYISEGAGSGVILSSDGYIMTNNHVIKGTNKINVTLKNGTSYEAKLIATDPKEDVAVIKIEANDLQAVVFGDSSALRVGDAAIAIGNPLGQLGGTVTNGIISALDRKIIIDNESMTLLQTNAAINPGNSGGGLFNANGELIGLVVAKSAGSDIEGLGFAIPSNYIKFVVEQLTEHGYVTGRASLQMSVVDITSAQMAMMYKVPDIGVYISKINSGSNSEKAGFKVGDRIVSINGKEVKTVADIDSVLDKCSVGDNATVVVSRNGQILTLNVILAEYVPNTDSTSKTTNQPTNILDFFFG